MTTPIIIAIIVGMWLASAALLALLWRRLGSQGWRRLLLLGAVGGVTLCAALTGYTWLTARTTLEEARRTAVDAQQELDDARNRDEVARLMGRADRAIGALTGQGSALASYDGPSARTVALTNSAQEANAALRAAPSPTGAALETATWISAVYLAGLVIAFSVLWVAEGFGIRTSGPDGPARPRLGASFSLDRRLGISIIFAVVVAAAAGLAYWAGSLKLGQGSEEANPTSEHQQADPVVPTDEAGHDTTSSTPSPASTEPVAGELSVEEPDLSNGAEPILDGELASYRTRIHEAWSSGPGFGGRYVITSIGCGTECRIVLVGDYQTGRIVDLGIGGWDQPALELQYDNESTFLTARWRDRVAAECNTQRFEWRSMSLQALDEPTIVPDPDYNGCDPLPGGDVGR